MVDCFIAARLLNVASLHGPTRELRLLPLINEVLQLRLHRALLRHRRHRIDMGCQMRMVVAVNVIWMPKWRSVKRGPMKADTMQRVSSQHIGAAFGNGWMDSPLSRLDLRVEAVEEAAAATVATMVVDSGWYVIRDLHKHCSVARLHMAHLFVFSVGVEVVLAPRREQREPEWNMTTTSFFIEPLLCIIDIRIYIHTYMREGRGRESMDACVCVYACVYR